MDLLWDSVFIVRCDIEAQSHPGKMASCFDHPDKVVILACMTCEGCYVCVKCVTTTHLNHQCVEIEEYRQIKEELRQQKRQQRIEAQEELKRLTDNAITASTKEHDTASSCEHIDESLKVEDGDIDGDVFAGDVVFRLLKPQLDENVHVREMPSLADELAGIQQIDTESDTSGHLDTESDKDDQNSDEYDNQSVTIYTETEIPEKLSCMKEISRVDSSYVRSICISAEDDAIWFSNCDMNLTKMSTDGEIIKSLCVYSVALDICSTSNPWSLWLCCSDNSIREVMNESHSETRFTTESVPICLGVLRNGDLVCGLKSGALVRYSSCGTIVSISDKNNINFVEPYKLSVCSSTNNIAVIDRCRHSLTVMDEHFNVQFQNNGIFIPDSSNKQSICPWDVCFDARGDIVILDYSNKIIASLCGKTGNFVKCLVNDYEHPTCLSMAQSGNVWIGYESGSMKLYGENNEVN